MAQTERPIPDLWQDYLFLTKEMLKFVSRRDMDMFYSLLKQRDQLQQLLDGASDDDFRKSAAGKEILSKIMPVNRAVNERLQLVYNQACRQMEISHSYEGSTDNAGARIDFQR